MKLNLCEGPAIKTDQEINTSGMVYLMVAYYISFTMKFKGVMFYLKTDSDLFFLNSLSGFMWASINLIPVIYVTNIFVIFIAYNR